MSHSKLAAIVQDDFEATLNFYDLDARIWRSLRSTNVIERFNRELRRKFNEMDVCKGDIAVDRTVAMVAMKITEDWQDSIVRGSTTPKRKATHF